MWTLQKCKKIKIEFFVIKPGFPRAWPIYKRISYENAFWLEDWTSNWLKCVYTVYILIIAFRMRKKTTYVSNTDY